MNSLFKTKFRLANFLSNFALKKINHNYILLYHSISKSFQRNIFTVDKNSFDLQMNIIFNSDLNVVKLSENNNGTKNISITFDDGYFDNFEIAMPILEKYSIPATVFINSSKIDIDKQFLTKKNIIKMHSNSINFGIHGHDHISFTELNEIDIKNQINQCKKFLEDLIQEEVFIASYPNGKSNERVKNILQECGIKLAFDSKSTSYINSINLDLMKIPRISIWNLDSQRSFKQKINGKWDWLESIR